MTDFFYDVWREIKPGYPVHLYATSLVDNLAGTEYCHDSIVFYISWVEPLDTKLGTWIDDANTLYKFSKDGNVATGEEASSIVKLLRDATSQYFDIATNLLPHKDWLKCPEQKGDTTIDTRSISRDPTLCSDYYTNFGSLCGVKISRSKLEIRPLRKRVGFNSKVLGYRVNVPIIPIQKFRVLKIGDDSTNTERYALWFTRVYSGTKDRVIFHWTKVYQTDYYSGSISNSDHWSSPDFQNKNTASEIAQAITQRAKQEYNRLRASVYYDDLKESCFFNELEFMDIEFVKEFPSDQKEFIEWDNSNVLYRIFAVSPKIKTYNPYISKELSRSFYTGTRTRSFSIYTCGFPLRWRQERELEEEEKRVEELRVARNKPFLDFWHEEISKEHPKFIKTIELLCGQYTDVGKELANRILCPFFAQDYMNELRHLQNLIQAVKTLPNDSKQRLQDGVRSSWIANGAETSSLLSWRSVKEISSWEIISQEEDRQSTKQRQYSDLLPLQDITLSHWRDLYTVIDLMCRIRDGKCEYANYPPDFTIPISDQECELLYLWHTIAISQFFLVNAYSLKHSKHVNKKLTQMNISLQHKWICDQVLPIPLCEPESLKYTSESLLERTGRSLRNIIWAYSAYASMLLKMPTCIFASTRQEFEKKIQSYASVWPELLVEWTNLLPGQTKHLHCEHPFFNCPRVSIRKCLQPIHHSLSSSSSSSLS